MLQQDFATNVLGLIPMVLSLTVHEWAHAWSAHKLGDDTAERMGRLTLNPLAHIDWIGTFLLPLMGVPFGWAKPVPVNSARFRRTVSASAGMAITASAGPISNLILAVLSAVGLGLVIRYGDRGAMPFVVLLKWSLAMNVNLAVFNLLPIPPLDGSRIVDHFIPARMRETWESVMRFGPLLLVAVMLTGGIFLRGPIDAVIGMLYRLVASFVT